MNNSKFLRKFILVLSTCLVIGGLSARERVGTPIELGKLDGGKFDVNRINTDISNTGFIVDYHPTGHSGMEWPAGAHTYSNFQSGIWFAGKVNDAIRTATAEYSTEFSPGVYDGDSGADEYQIYKVNKSDLADPLSSDDFQNWPAHRGAPWVDNDGDGVYSPLPAGPDHPEFIGDQVIFYTMTDGDASSHVLYGTMPLGIEVRVTMWGYNRPDAFGDMMFVKMQAFNRGGVDITDMFVGLWDDPDLGDAGDDYVGCDTDLSLGFCYNDGPDAEYGDAAPALGYDFFQATVPGGDGSAFGFGQTLEGYQNLPMSSFVKYINGDEVYYDPETSQEVYNYMSGLRADGTPFVNSSTGEDSKFVHPCDPNNDTGTSDDCWVDGDDHDSADRRFLMNVGPFTFPADDSLEVVFGIIHAQAGDALSSVTLLKEVDQLAQLAYDIQFALPDSPPQPVVSATASFEEIIITWDDSAESYVAEDEIDLIDGESTYFYFEGYNVWQHEDANGTGDKVLLATFDLINGTTEIYDDVFDPNYGVSVNVPVQMGSDSGIKRWLSISSDKLNGGSLLINDREYYFTVNAYGYNVNGIPKTLESADNILSIRPQKSVSTETNVEIGFSDFDITHSGGSDGTITVSVVDPYEITGDDYEVYIDTGHYYRDVDGIWKATAYEDSVGRFLGRSRDCSGSTITAAALASANVGTVDLTFTFDMVCGDNWVDGIVLDLPDDLVVNSWDAIAGCSYPDYGQNCENMDGTIGGSNTITWGNNILSTFGAIQAGQVWTVNVELPTSFPFDISYTVHDDGYDGTVTDASGIATVSELGYEFKSIQQWNILNTTTGELVVADQTMVSGVYYENIVDGVIIEETIAFGDNSNPVFDGLQVAVNGPTNGIHGIWQTANGNGPIEGVDEDVNENILWLNFLTAPDYPTQQAQGGWAFVTHGGGTANDWDSFYERVFRGTNFTRAIPNDFEMRFTQDALDNGLGYRRFEDGLIIGDVPFELWSIGTTPDDPSDDYRMLPAILNGAGLGAADDNIDAFDLWGDDESSSSDNDPSSDWVYWGNPDDMSPGTVGYDSFFAPGIGAEATDSWTEVIARTRVMNWNRYLGGGDIFTDGGALDSAAAELAMPEVGTVFRWITNKPNTTDDSFAFSTASEVSSEIAFDCEEVNVWPNPYFGYNPEEQNSLDYQMHFTDLPDNATISIYNLAGSLVRKLEHSGSQNEIWDLQNSFGVPVASGMYIAYIDTDDCQAVLKLAVVVPEQRLDRY